MFLLFCSNTTLENYGNSFESKSLFFSKCIINSLIFTCFMLIFLDIFTKLLSFISKNNPDLFTSFIPLKMNIDISQEKNYNILNLVIILFLLLIGKFLITLWENKIFKNLEQDLFETISYSLKFEISTNFYGYDQLCHNYFHNYISDIIIGIRNQSNQLCKNIASLTGILTSIFLTISKENQKDNIFYCYIASPFIFALIYQGFQIRYKNIATKAINDNVIDYIKNNNNVSFKIDKLINENLSESLQDVMNKIKDIFLYGSLIMVAMNSKTEKNLNLNNINIECKFHDIKFLVILPIFLVFYRIFDCEVFNLKNSFNKYQVNRAKISIFQNLPRILKKKNNSNSNFEFSSLEVNNLKLQDRHFSGQNIFTTDNINFSIKKGEKMLFYYEKQSKNLDLFAEQIINYKNTLDNNRIFLFDDLHRNTKGQKNQKINKSTNLENNGEDNNKGINKDDNIKIKKLDINSLSQEEERRLILLKHTMSFESEKTILENFQFFIPGLTSYELSEYLQSMKLSLTPESKFQENFPRKIRFKIIFALYLTLANQSDLIVLDYRLFQPFSPDEIEYIINLILNSNVATIFFLSKNAIPVRLLEFFSRPYYISKKHVNKSLK